MKIDPGSRTGRTGETEAAEVLVLTRCEGERSEQQDGSARSKLTRRLAADLIQSGEFEGKPAKLLVYHTQGKVPAKRLLLVGLGKKNELQARRDSGKPGAAVKRVRQAKSIIYRVMPAVTAQRTDPARGGAGDGGRGDSWAIISSPPIGATTVRRANDVERMTLSPRRRAQLRQMTEGIRRGVATAEATVFVRDLCNHPSNVMTPTRIASEAQDDRESTKG